MANDLNLCQFIGRLGQDPEMKATPAGVSVASFSIACGEKYKNKDGKQIENTEWIRCVAWRQLADVIGKYLNKGSQVYVSGKWKTRTWEKDGVKHYATELVVDNMQMLGSKGESSSSRPDAPPPADDDVPF